MHLTHRLSDVKSFQNSRSNTCTPSHAIEFLSFGLAALDFRVFDVPSNGHAFSTCSRDFLFISFFLYSCCRWSSRCGRPGGRCPFQPFEQVVPNQRLLRENASSHRTTSSCFKAQSDRPVSLKRNKFIMCGRSRHIMNMTARLPAHFTLNILLLPHTTFQSITNRQT